MKQYTPLTLYMVYARNFQQTTTTHTHTKERGKKEENKAISITPKAKSPPITKPNYPRGQRSHDEIINRNAKGILNRKRDFEKNNHCYLQMKWTIN